MQDKISDELQAIQDAWKILSERYNSFYTDHVIAYDVVNPSPCHQAATFALISAMNYLKRQAQILVTGDKNDPNPST
jgi:hypothetical protein